ncbi:semaphorin-4A isoform X2 [Denticeps clupeoides]|uniref:semaphorin-4A isoform X2 n=1 Tax=Denticeps clupeoides TaxID=299321 RepID=UPI0010A40C3C|nr:semaphorin-4A-like isoform X2 [Denticeps clupeoides]
MTRRVSLWTTMVLLQLVGPADMNDTPRVSFTLGSPSRALTRFTSAQDGNTTTLLLSDDGDTLFVGARDAILSLDVRQASSMVLKGRLDWSPSEKDLDDCTMKGKRKTDCSNFVRVLQVLNSTHMYACGTFAFSPRCTYINSETFSLMTDPSGKQEEGRGRCPYDPYQRNTAIVVDGELYTATVADYHGNWPVISRHLSEGSRVDLKLDDMLGWVEDPTFISSTYVPSEEKVYFFFSEVGREYDFIDKLTVSRVAQVCTSDIGGQRTLQKRWTTFAKAQLLCHSDGELPYNVIEDVVTLPPAEGASADDTLFYGIFSSQWSVNSGRSAVCVFRLGDVKAVFAGNYKALNRDTLRWSSRIQEKIARPGECGLHSASDNALRFVKENFLAEENVHPVGQRLAMVSADQLYSNIAAQRVTAADGRNYTVLYLLTDSGLLHKVVLLDDGPHVVEEVRLFPEPQPVKSLLLSISKGAVFVGSAEGVLKVPVANCSFYWSCAECVLARDPFCGWDPSLHACAEISSIRANVGQDVEGGNVSKACMAPMNPSPRSTFTQQRPVNGELVTVSLNEVVRLRCPEASRLARRHWKRPNSRLSPDLYLQQADGSLQFLATPSTLGPYLCLSEENGYEQILVAFQVKQKSNPTPMPAATPSHAYGQPTTHVWVGPRRVDIKENGKEGSMPTVTQESTSENSHKTSRKVNFTFRPNSWAETDSVNRAGGDTNQRMDTPCYLKELVVVSVLLVLCVSALLTAALYGLRQRCRSRTVPQSCSRRDPERGAAPQEREALRSQSPHATSKHNGQAHNGHAGKGTISLGNGVVNGSNGHLPNTPI